MALEIEDFNLGGNWLKPEEHLDAAGILWEVKGYLPSSPSKWGPKPAVVVDATVFATQADIDAGRPSATFPNAQLQQTVLVKNLQPLVGKATITGLTQLPPRDGNRAAYALEPVPKPVRDGIAAYANARDEADQAAVADAPDFD